MAVLRNIGIFLFISSLIIWLMYILFFFIPTYQANSNVVGQGFIVSLVCGSIATLGAIILKKYN